ncbi:MAG: TonB-dependent receptor [Acidobacteriales bacterium 59-55]|nr:TonB-dependent receptor [Terriglobales bacterium]OJV44285.1 MAG: TonB-dependent receptor [Acidobacteriales bacterium 59-55]
MSSLPRRAWILAFSAILSLPLFTPLTTTALFAQTAAGRSTLSGTVLDPSGNVLPSAAILLKDDAGSLIRKATADSQGHFSIAGLPAGRYTVSATAPGFSTAVQRSVPLLADQAKDLSFSLSLGNFSQQVTVEGGASNSIAARLAPMGAPLDARSARTEVNANFIQNFTAPTADYGELVAMVPGTVTTNGNGVGLGQSDTAFRGFADGNYDIDFDGIPFYDTNTPTHHSWAFFPSQWIGGVDFDRSPGTASTIGPTPFGGSIHLLSKPMSPERNLRGGFSYGSFNTVLFDGSFDSGNFGGYNKRSNLFIDVHHMTSDGYQTFNRQTRNAGSLKYQYKLSDKTVLTGFAGVIWLDSNSPNLSSTRAQLLANGDNYLLQNTDNTRANFYRYNYYHVPTDFEYIGVNSQLGRGWSLDFKPYTYNYDNSEFYAKQPKGGAPINEDVCAIPVKKISPCAVDKYNSYRKYGETLAVSQTSGRGIFRTGLWYERAATNRHQFPSNPFTLKDDVLPNFSEKFWTNSYQPYAEYQYMATRKLSVSAGLKFAYYTMALQQFADNGGKIGSVNPVTGKPFTVVYNSVDYHSWLPSIDANYRIKPNWSVYAQASTGSVVPPSNVYDTAGALVGTPPKPQTSTTYQTGTVVKLKRVTFDADFYHTRFQNGYSSSTDNNPDSPLYGESIQYISPSSITLGGEFESSIYLGRGLSLYLNGTRGKATYVGTLTVYSPDGSTSNPLVVKAPSGLWVSGTPTDTEAEGLTYQERGWNVGIFNKRVGSQWEDNGAYHNQLRDDPYSVSNAFINYTIRGHSHFDQTKIRLSVNNLLDSHNVTSVKPGGALVAAPLTVAGLTYVNPFVGTTTSSPGYTGGRNLADNPNLLPGRSIMLSVTFGFSPER